jgi:LacI family transcriptional regulator
MRSPFYVKCVNYLNRLLTQEGYQMLVVNATAMESAAVRPLDLADGIIAIECSYEIDSFLKTHPAFAPPFVSVGAYFVESVDHVSVDLYGSEREALDQLISIGCKRIAFALGDGRSDAPDQRRSAYLDGMKEAGLKTEMIQVPKDLRSEARGAVKEYIRQNGCPDGILCHNDDKALGIYRGLRELGLNVPNDVALVGCDGIDELEYLDCPISTIVQPVESICETAWAFLQNRIADPEIPRQEKALKSRFVMRESSNRAHAEP